MTMNGTEVSTKIFDNATRKANVEKTNVIIFKSEIVMGRGKTVSYATEKQFNESPIRHELERIQMITPEGSFVH